MEQFERAQRYLVRMRAIYAGVFEGERSKNDCEDDVMSFFVHCYHIKDWIVHLNNIGMTSKQVDTFIDQNECLRICADLSNGAKHCTLTKMTRTATQRHVVGRKYETSTWFTGSGGGKVLKGAYSIMTAAGVIDALSLAEDCMHCWSTFIERMQGTFESQSSVNETRDA